jgi:hypothetical protein
MLKPGLSWLFVLAAALGLAVGVTSDTSARSASRLKDLASGGGSISGGCPISNECPCPAATSVATAEADPNPAIVPHAFVY